MVYYESSHKLGQERFVLLTVGRAYLSICAAKDADRQEVTEAVNRRVATDLPHDWEIHPETMNNPMPCPLHADRQHWLLSC